MKPWSYGFEVWLGWTFGERRRQKPWQWNGRTPSACLGAPALFTEPGKAWQHLWLDRNQLLAVFYWDHSGHCEGNGPKEDKGSLGRDGAGGQSQVCTALIASAQDRGARLGTENRGRESGPKWRKSCENQRCILFSYKYVFFTRYWKLKRTSRTFWYVVREANVFMGKPPGRTELRVVHSRGADRRVRQQPSSQTQGNWKMHYWLYFILTALQRGHKTQGSQQQTRKTHRALGQGQGLTSAKIPDAAPPFGLTSYSSARGVKQLVIQTVNLSSF